MDEFALKLHEYKSKRPIIAIYTVHSACLKTSSKSPSESVSPSKTKLNAESAYTVSKRSYF